MRYGRFTVDPLVRKEGGQAFVHFSVDPETGQEVAVKVARPSDWSHKRMRTEIAAQRRLKHPNILELIAYDPARRWHATARAQSSLEDLGPFLPDRWSYLRTGLLAVASAVSHAHDLGYLHRDLSPGNILVFEGGWVVSDWGFVYSPSDKGGPRMTQALEVFGTRGFMAPEMALDPRTAKEPADVFSIGRLAAWATRIERGDGGSDDAITAWWRLLVNGTTEWDPAARWTMQDVRAHLRATLSPVSPMRAGAPAASAGAQIIQLHREVDVCPQCGHAAGYDASARCIVCHAVAAY